MSFVVDAVRSGRWLTAERIRVYGRTAAVFSALALLALVASSENLVDRFGRPIGTDFSAFYSAGTLARAGEAAAAYDWARLYALQQQLFGEGTPFYSWSYPPFALLMLAPLAALPYGCALVVFIGASFVLYLAVVRKMAAPGPEAFWAIVGFPGVFINAGHGQNGFVAAALFGGALLLLRSRPVLAGAALGLLAFKPQLGLLVPVALLAGRHWTPLLAAAGTVALMTVASLMIYGPAAWTGFLHASSLSREAILEEGATGFSRLQSVFGAVRLLGGPSALAWFVQAVVSTAMAILVWSIWRRPIEPRIKGAVLVIASLLATPFLNSYDLVLLAIPAALVASLGPPYLALPWERSAFLAAWVLPTLAVGSGVALRIPLAPVVLAALLALCLRRAWATAPE